MDNKIEIFKNEQFGEVRTILEGEKVLFCAADVAKALGYTNPNKAVNDHCRAITKRSTPISGKVQSINFIPEGDVYRLIIRSKLPAAEKFELWVFDEVIPTIRKTGSYMTDSLLERIQKEPAVIVEFAQALILEKNRVKALECELITAKPKADYYDAFINPDDCTNIRTTAKELKIPERKFVQFLLKEKYLFRSPSGQLLPYNKDSNAGLFIVRDFVTFCYTGSQTYFTPKGKEVIRMKFQKKCGRTAFQDGKVIFVAVYRVNKNRGYTVMANFHLRDKSLSLKAVGLLSKMLSFNDGWKFSTKGLSAICKEGPDAILSALRELEKHGYLVRHRQRDGKGRMSSTIFEIYEEPQESTPEREIPHTENPCVEKPDVDNPRGDKSAQINTDQVITQERNTLSKNYQSINLDGMDRMDERSEYEEIIKENLDYDILCQDPKFDKDRFREIMYIMLDAVCSTAPTIRINGEDMPQQVVKSRFLKLNSSHIEYVLEAMNKNPSDIRNIRAYLLTALYNASLTIDNYYSALVNHDFYGQDRSAGSKKPKTYDYSLCEDTL